MSHIPEVVKHQGLIPGFRLIAQGKVRDIYEVPGRPDLQLQVASNRISTNDFVLSTLVDQKGAALTALTYYWFTEYFSEVPNHLEPHPHGKEYGNFAVFLAERYPQIPLGRALVVKKMNMVPYEFVFRHHIGGSTWKDEYLLTGTIGGIKAPTGLHKWAKLAEPAFTPARKAADGHDENIAVELYLAETGAAGYNMMQFAQGIYMQAYRAAAIHGILILDTKFELGHDESGSLYLADEILTPDSSRFTMEDALPSALDGDKDPPFWDKQPVRDWASTVVSPFLDQGGQSLVGLGKLSPANIEHLAFVDSLAVPEKVISDTTSRYRDIFFRITGRSLEQYQKEKMFVDI